VTDTLDAEVATEILVASVQDAADRYINRGYLPSSLVLLASPRTIRDQKLLLRVGHILDVKEAAINTGDLVICPTDEAQKYLRAAPSLEN
jgi:hypothetical protein